MLFSPLPLPSFVHGGLRNGMLHDWPSAFSPFSIRSLVCHGTCRNQGKKKEIPAMIGELPDVRRHI